MECKGIKVLLGGSFLKFRTSLEVGKCYLFAFNGSASVFQIWRKKKNNLRLVNCVCKVF